MAERIKTGLAVTEKHLKLCDDNLERADIRSRNDFVEKAIEFYSGYLNAEQNPNFFEEMFTSSAEKKMDTLSKTFGTGQYKIAVELAKLCVLLAENLDIPEQDFRQLHEKCAAEVKALGSLQTFEKIYQKTHE